MTKRSQFIITISAVFISILAFILDLTYFGKDWNIVWKSIELTRIVIILTIVAAIGSFLALFLYLRQRYRQRILLTIPIGFILFSLAHISKTAISYYGLDEEYNYFSAQQDIKNGNVRIFETGLILPTPNVDWDKQKNAEKITASHFGYKSVYLGCVVTHGIGIYNRTMEDYLDELNGKDWRVKEKQMFDSLMNSKTLR